MINDAVIPTISQTIRAMNSLPLVQPNGNVVAAPTGNVTQPASVVEQEVHSIDTHV